MSVDYLQRKSLQRGLLFFLKNFQDVFTKIKKNSKLNKIFVIRR